MPLEQDIVGYLEGDELRKWMVAEATIAAVRSNPEAFSRQETIDAHLVELVLLSTYYETFRVDKKREISVNAASGAVALIDDEYEEEED